MTGENKRLNAEAELARADECLAEARLLFENGHQHGAASRAYYCVFHAARALLFSSRRGIRPPRSRRRSSSRRR